jgi:competence protein ComEC
MKKHQIRLIFSALIVVAAFVWVSFFSKQNAISDNLLHVYFLNVGQGDSEYIKLPSGEDILIDGGPDDKVLAELGRVMNVGDKEINLVVLTHPHADHVTGLVDVLQRYNVKEVWGSGADYPSSAYDAFKNEINKNNIKNISVVARENRDFGNTNFKVLYPLSSFENKKIDNVNNASVITELKDNKISFLFLGDAEGQEQQQILNNLGQTTVVKVAHHGSVNGLLEDLYKITRPAIAIIEVGAKNTYGHPATATISLLKKYAVQIYRTDQNGTIDISTDGTTYSIKTQ